MKRCAVGAENYDLNNKGLTIALGVLYVYNFKLSYTVASYFIPLFRGLFLSPKQASNDKFITRFRSIRGKCVYNFREVVINNYQRVKIVFESVRISDLNDDEYDLFMENNQDLWLERSFDIRVDNDFETNTHSIHLGIYHTGNLG